MYNDEARLTAEGYELMAKAYAEMLKNKGFKIVSSDSLPSQEEISSLFETLSSIKAHLLMLGGFLSTGSFYSLNERHIKKLALIFDFQSQEFHSPRIYDKTKCFLSFLSKEFSLISQLLTLAEKTSFEEEIKKIIKERLSHLSQILAL